VISIVKYTINDAKAEVALAQAALARAQEKLRDACESPQRGWWLFNGSEPMYFIGKSFTPGCEGDFAANGREYHARHGWSLMFGEYIRIR